MGLDSLSNGMITLAQYPDNNSEFVRLLVLFKEVLDICNDLNVSLVLDGSLAVFAYTAQQDMRINDVDLACSEAEFPKIIKVLDERRISYKLRAWHVLQILRDDLKVELDSIEHWYKDLALEYETLQIDGYRVRMLSLNSLRAFYRRGVEDTAKNTDEPERRKYEALKAKCAALERVKG
jgi:hypothetical protein